MAIRQPQDLELELESEFENELESPGQSEFEGELEGEFEGELESLGELEAESEWEGEAAHEQEQFFGKLLGGIRSVVRRAAPLVGRIARVAVPMLSRVVGGPIGGMLGQLAGGLLGEEQELETELELETEGESAQESLGEHEFEHEMEYEGAHEFEAAHMAAAAATAESEHEAEAMLGAASVSVLSPRDRAAIARLLPHLVRGTALLSRLLRRRRITRPYVRIVPTIMRQTVRTIARRQAQGAPVTRQVAGRIMGLQTRRILSNPRTCAHLISRNVRVVRRIPTATRGTQRVRPVRG